LAAVSNFGLLSWQYQRQRSPGKKTRKPKAQKDQPIGFGDTVELNLGKCKKPAPTINMMVALNIEPDLRRAYRCKAEDLWRVSPT
jgi:hypothetical protein